MLLALLDGFWDWGASAAPGSAYHLLLALWSNQWGSSGSVSTSATISFSLTFSFSYGEGGGGGHKHHHPYHWYEQEEFIVADDEYWVEREKLMKRHMPLTPVLAKKEQPEKIPEAVQTLARQHDELMLESMDITNLKDLRILFDKLEEIAKQILSLELQSEQDEDDAIALLLLS
jgi:hypothetical protein